MTHTPEIIHQLNEALRMQLTSINQCFLHARILKHRGLMQLADGEFKESLDSMKYADHLVERILGLGGAPHMQPMGEIKVGDDRASMLACDIELKEEVREQLAGAIAVCVAHKDAASTEILQRILASVEEHIRYIEREKGQMDAA